MRIILFVLVGLVLPGYASNSVSKLLCIPREVETGVAILGIADRAEIAAIGREFRGKSGTSIPFFVRFDHEVRWGGGGGYGRRWGRVMFFGLGLWTVHSSGFIT